MAELAVAAVLALLVVWEAGSLRPGDVEHESEPGAEATEHSQTMLLAAVALLFAHLALLRVPSYGEISEGGDLAGHNIWFIGCLFGLAAVGALTFCSGKGTVAHVGAFFLLPLLAASSTYLQQKYGWPAAVPYVAWGVLALLWFGLLLKQYRGVDASPVAWQGAGASLLLNAAGWTALLFTTAVVTFGADQLNGKEHDVADLQTSYAASQVGSALNATDLDLVDSAAPYGRYTYVLGGDDVKVVVVSSTSPATGSWCGRAGWRQRPWSGCFQGPTRSRVGSRCGSVPPRCTTPCWCSPPTSRCSSQDGCLRSGSATEKDPSGECTVEEAGFVASAALDTKEAEVSVSIADGSPDVDVAVTDPPQAPLVLPQVLVWAPLVQVAWFLLALLVAGLCLFRLTRRVKRPVLAAVEADPAIPRRDRDACVHARVRAAYAHRAERLLDILGAMTVPIVLILIVGASTGTAPWVVWSGFRPLAEVALWGVLGFSLALVLVLSRMRKDDKARKGVGILWDLTTFWPRAAHPMAPPCYAERVVPELLVRIRWILRDTRHLVVLSGHSQGSAILMAVASRFGRDELKRVRIITYGSQIRTWYGRIFPAVMGPAVLGYTPTTRGARFSDPEPDAPAIGTPFPAEPNPPEVDGAGPLRQRLIKATGWSAGRTPPWVNLFRRSDPLGFRVFSDGEGVHDRYVPEVPVDIGGDPGPRVMTHSGYPHTPTYLEVLANWEKDVPAGTFEPPFRTVPFFPEP